MSKREEAALAAGWRPAREFSKENIAAQWAWPQLRLRVWADLRGYHLLASIEQVDDRGRLRSVEVGRAHWAPTPPVSESRVVEWGYRALGAWLGEQVATD